MNEKKLASLWYNLRYRLTQHYLENRFISRVVPQLAGRLQRWARHHDLTWIKDAKIRDDYRKIITVWGLLSNSSLDNEIKHYTELLDGETHEDVKQWYRDRLLELEFMKETRGSYDYADTQEITASLA